MNPERLALLVATGTVMVLLVRDGCRGKPPVDPAAGLRTDVMIERLEADGWEVVEAEAQSDLIATLAALEGDTARLNRRVAEMARQAFVAGAELRAVTELQLQAETALRLAGEVHETAETLPGPETASGGDNATPDSVTSTFGDGVFSGRVSYFPAPSEFGLELRARIAAALVITEAADGRTLFSAAPSDPRVNLQLQASSWQPPAPLQVCSLGQKVRGGTLSIAGWEIGKLLFGALQGR